MLYLLFQDKWFCSAGCCVSGQNILFASLLVKTKFEIKYKQMRTSKQPSNRKKEKRTISIDWQEKEMFDCFWKNPDTEKEMIECRKNWLVLYQRRRKHGCNAVPGLEEGFFFYFISYNFLKIVRIKV